MTWRGGVIGAAETTLVGWVRCVHYASKLGLRLGGVGLRGGNLSTRVTQSGRSFRKTLHLGAMVATR